MTGLQQDSNSNSFVGVDVGGRKGYHAIALDDRGLKDIITTSNVAAIANWIATQNPKIIAVDAPCRWSINGRSRKAERQLMSQKIWCFSTPTRDGAIAHPKNHFNWMLAGEALYEQLYLTHRYFDGNRDAALPYCLETFPHAAVCALRGRVISAKGKGRVRRQLLEELGLETSRLPNIDFVDAALCAVVAKCFASNSFRAYGSFADGYIVVPLASARFERDEQTRQNGSA